MLVFDNQHQTQSTVMPLLGHKPKNRTVLMKMVLDEKLKDHQRFYASSSGGHVCTKFHGNASNCFVSQQQQKTPSNVKLMVALKENQGINNIIMIHPLGTLNVCT